jgi:hypothetical protein
MGGDPSLEAVPNVAEAVRPTLLPGAAVAQAAGNKPPAESVAKRFALSAAKLVAVREHCQ